MNKLEQIKNTVTANGMREWTDEMVSQAMQEYSDQQNSELKERVKELEGICEYALKAIKVVNSPLGATRAIIKRIEKSLKK